MNKEYLMFRELYHEGKTKKYAVVSKNNQDIANKRLSQTILELRGN